jgi:outer membrane receptor protein involved in Fe transport
MYFAVRYLYDTPGGNRLTVPVDGTFRASDSVITVVGFGDLVGEQDDRKFWLKPQYEMTYHALGAEVDTVFGMDLGIEDSDTSSVFAGGPPTDTTYDRVFTAAWYSQQWDFQNDWFLSLSVRVDRADLEAEQRASGTTNRVSFADTEWSPSVGVSWNVSESSTLYAGWGRVFRFPNRDELSGFFNPALELDPETGDSIEIGVKKCVSDWFTSTLAWYWLSMDDEIFFVPPATGAFAFGSNQNVDEILHQGIEWNASIRPTSEIDWWWNYTFANTRIKSGSFEGSELPVTPRNHASMGAAWRFQPGWSASVDGEFVGVRHLINDLDNDLNKANSYVVYHAGLSWRGDGFRASVRANNLTDRLYDDNGAIGGFPHGSRVAFNPAPEANYTFSLRVDF